MKISQRYNIVVLKQILRVFDALNRRQIRDHSSTFYSIKIMPIHSFNKTAVLHKCSQSCLLQRKKKIQYMSLFGILND